MQIHTWKSKKHSRKDLDSLGMLKGFHLHGAQLLEANIMDSVFPVKVQDELEVTPMELLCGIRNWTMEEISLWKESLLRNAITWKYLICVWVGVYYWTEYLLIVIVHGVPEVKMMVLDYV